MIDTLTSPTMDLYFYGQASIMDRFCMREEQQLTADGSVLEADWKQLEE